LFLEKKCKSKVGVGFPDDREISQNIRNQSFTPFPCLFLSKP